MKSQIKKVIALVACLCLILPMSVYFATADGAATATLDFTAPNRVSQDANQQVWQENGITVTNNKAGSTTDVGNYGGNGYAARFYKNSELIVAYPGMTQIVFHCDNYNNTDYAGALAAAIVTGTAVQDGTDVTVTLDAAADTYTIPALSGGQVRMVGITVNPSEGGDDNGDNGGEPVTPDEPAASVVTTPEVGVAYKLGLDQTAKGAIYYFTGTMSTYYGATDTDVANAVDMYLENAEGGYKLYFNADGAKQYIKLEQSGTHYNFTFGAEGSVFTLDAEKNALRAPCGDQICYMGTYSNFVTVGTLTEEKLTDTDYIARLYSVGEGGNNGGDPVNPPVDPGEPVDPDVPVYSVVTTPEVGVAYKLGLDQTDKGEVYYFTGEMSGYYGATDTDVANAVDMYLENAEGGYKLYFNDATGAKQYIKLEQSGTHYNFTFGAEGSVFTLDAEKNALCAPCGDQICYMGTYGNYVTVGTLTEEKLADTDYIARLYSVAGDDNGGDNGGNNNQDNQGGNNNQDNQDNQDNQGGNNNQDNLGGDNENTDVPGETDPMGENVTGIVVAAILLTLAIAGVIVFSKKRA